jgi:hypothetical protein
VEPADLSKHLPGESKMFASAVDADGSVGVPGRMTGLPLPPFPHAFAAASFVWWNRGWQTDAHEETGESLGKMLQKRRLKSPTFGDLVGMGAEIFDRKADYLAKIHHKRVAIACGILGRRQELKTLDSALADFLPPSAFAECRVHPLESGNPGDWTEGGEICLVVQQIACLRDNDKIRLFDAHLFRLMRSKFRMEHWNQAANQIIALSQRRIAGVLPPVTGVHRLMIPRLLRG